MHYCSSGCLFGVTRPSVSARGLMPRNESLGGGRHFVAILLLGLGFATNGYAQTTQPAADPTITIATYNIENWKDHFVGHKMSQAPTTQRLDRELINQERRQNDEDNWEIAMVISDPAFRPDILVVQEGCAENDLEFFNRRWLNNLYETVLVLNTNTERDQHLNVLLKPGFKIIDRKDKYHEEPDTVPNDRGNRLFARGPGFLLIESPTGYRFWVGTTHQKSKGGNNVAVTQWRNREAIRTHEIMKELSAAGPEDVILLGDMNDELGIQEFETEAGGDTIALLVGPPEDGFVLATEELAKSGVQSFGGYWNAKHRSFIDHIVTTSSMKDQILSVQVVSPPLAPVASDHYPVMITIKPDPVPQPATRAD
jgi:endonuclease/exonuclease/phosphatase family metal-dependent hydrolase